MSILEIAQDIVASVRAQQGKEPTQEQVWEYCAFHEVPSAVWAAAITLVRGGYGREA